MQLRLYFVLLLAAACAEPVQPPAREVGSLLFIGNSITRHQPDLALGWTGHWGMAASADSLDYSHRLVARFASARAERVDLAGFESGYRSFDLSVLDAYLAAAPEVVVVELGDNVHDLPAFPPYYDALITRVAGRTPGVVLCTSTWWRNEAVNAAIRSACSRANTRYVDISNLRRDPSTWAAFERSYASRSVGQHPGDRGMQLIADALYEALRR